MFRTYFHFSDFQLEKRSGSKEKNTSFDPKVMKQEVKGHHFEIAKSFSDYEALEQDWNDLQKRSPNHDQPFQSYNWNWHWCRNYLCPEKLDKNLRIITLWQDAKAGQDKKLVMLWPMQVKTILGQRHLHFIGDPVSQYGDILLDRDADAIKLLHAAWFFIRTNLSIDLVVLRKIKRDASLYPLLHDLNGYRTHRDQGLYLDLGSYQDFDGYHSKFKAKELKNRRRKLRRLQQFGEVRTVFLSEGEQASKIARLAIEMKAHWLEQKGLLSKAFQNEKMADFFGNIAASTTKGVGTHISVLYVGAKVAAITISFGSKQYQAMHINVINMEFEKNSPGVTLLEETIKHAFEQKDGSIDFLAPADHYKKIWCNKINYVEDYAIATNLSGQIYTTLLLKWIREGGKDLLMHLPQKARLGVNKLISTYVWHN